jgi:ABC-2 type transport system ATP-binding protein
LSISPRFPAKDAGESGSLFTMIKVNNLKKTFGPKVAVNGVSFTVEKGEVLGFLGPNGAGKSTTMRMITGFIPPTAGDVFVGGHNMSENPIEAKRLLGYLPENAPSYTDMSVEGFLNFCAEMRGFRGEDRRKAVHRAVDMCFLEGVLHQSVETLSKGYKHRTCFAQSILHDPPALILDEPTDGLDPNQKHEMRTLIRRMGETKAIIFSTHILEEVETACTRAIIIDRGTIVANGTPGELKKRSNLAGAVTLRVANANASAINQRLKSLPEVGSTLVLSDSPVAIRAIPGKNASGGGKNGSSLAAAIHEVALREAWKLEELHTEEGRLDEVFRSITMSDTATKEAR